MAEINTIITLFWQIQYISCNGSCLSVDLYSSDANNHTSYPLINSEIGDGFLYDESITWEEAGPNAKFSYANVRVIMFINEHVCKNVKYLSCIARLSNVDTPARCNTVRIQVTNQIATTTATTSNQPTSESTSARTPTCTCMYTGNGL